MQIRGDFHVGKKWGSVYRICSHVLHAPTLWRTFFGLAITKKEGVVEIVEGVTLQFARPSVKLRCHSDLSVLALALLSMTLYLFIFICIF